MLYANLSVYRSHLNKPHRIKRPKPEREIELELEPEP